MKVLIKEQALKDMLAYSKCHNEELGGLCRADVIDNKIVILETYLPKQEVTSTTTELDPIGLAQLEMETMNKQGDLFVWWHSHHTMGVSPSGQDNKQLLEFATNAGRCLRLIVNHRGDVGAKYMQLGNGLHFEVDCNVEIEEDTEWIESIKKKIKDNVSKLVTQHVTYPNAHYSSYSGGNCRNESVPYRDDVKVTHLSPTESTKVTEEDIIKKFPFLRSGHEYCTKTSELRCVRRSGSTLIDIEWNDYYNGNKREHNNKVRASIKEYNDYWDKVSIEDEEEIVDADAMMEFYCDTDYWDNYYATSNQQLGSEDDVMDLFLDHRSSNSAIYQEFIALTQGAA